MIDRFKKGERGQALVEFALVFPIFLFMLLGVIDYSHVSSADTQITNATQEAAKEYTHLVRSEFDGDINQELRTVVISNVNTVPDENIQISSKKIAINTGAGEASGERVTVKVTAYVPSLTNFSFKNVKVEREVTLRVPE